MLSFIMLNAIMLSFVMLNAIMLSFVLVNAITLFVVASLEATASKCSYLAAVTLKLLFTFYYLL